MSYAIMAVLFVVWAAAVLSGHALGGWVHLLLAVTLLALLVKITSRPRRTYSRALPPDPLPRGSHRLPSRPSRFDHR